MKDTNLFSDNILPRSINEGGLQMNSKVVKTAIRNLVMDSAPQTRSGLEGVCKFVNYLKNKRIKVDME